MAVVPVALAGRSYEVRIDSGLLPDIARQCGPLLRKEDVPVITDQHVAAHWRSTVDKSLIAAGKKPCWLIHPPGEATKSWEGLSQSVEWLLEQGVERGDHVIALGGGVIGDLTGFACAILKRGCGFIQVPTTLLAQVDSSVGGKTAINTPAGKNLVGAFHQPSLVLADRDTLATLPMREIRAGYAEVLKYGILGDRAFFDWCANNHSSLLAGNRDAQIEAVARSVEAKARIVAEDERETTGARALLNLGHTFGHALEAETGFSDRLLHGEAVALGMVLAAKYSARLGLMPQEDAEKIHEQVASAGLPDRLNKLNLLCSGKVLANNMLYDKKMDAGTLPFVLLKGIGQAFLDRNVDLNDVADFLDEELN